MEWVETTGRTIEDAKESALDQLGVDESEAEFEVLEQPRTGLFGRTGERLASGPGCAPPGPGRRPSAAIGAGDARRTRQTDAEGRGRQPIAIAPPARRRSLEKRRRNAPRRRPATAAASSGRSSRDS